MILYVSPSVLKALPDLAEVLGIPVKVSRYVPPNTVILLRQDEP